MSEQIFVKNDRGQVTGFTVDGPLDPRAQVLRQRIARGELALASKSDKSGAADAAAPSILAGVRDEKGDLLASVHGGGLDPDAVGDARGIPSGSGIGAAQAAKDAAVAGEALDQMVKNADSADVTLSETTRAVKVTVDAQAEGARKSK